MSYQELVREVAAVHVSEIEADLEQARHSLSLARQEVQLLEHQIAGLESLLELTSDQRGPSASARAASGMTLHEAMAEVLRGEREHMLRAGDLAAEIERRRLYRMRDGRPVEAQQIHARVGHYPQMFTKEGTFIKLVEEGD